MVGIQLALEPYGTLPWRLYLSGKLPKGRTGTGLERRKATETVATLLAHDQMIPVKEVIRERVTFREDPRSERSPRR